MNILLLDIALTALIAGAVFIKGVWPFEPAAGALTQLALLALALAAISLALDHSAGAIIAAIGVALALRRTREAFAPATSPITDAQAKIVWANLFRRHKSFEAVQRLALKENADIVAFAEFPAGAKPQPDFASVFAHQFPEDPTPLRDVVVFSRHPFVSAKTVFSTWRRPSLVATTEIAGEALTVIAMHAPVPWTPSRLETQRRHIAETFANAELRRPSLIVGDFNAAPWNAALNPPPTITRLHLGPSSTWLFPLPLLGIPIDHAFVSAGLKGSVARGPFNGSDHFPIIVSVKRRASPQ